MKRKRRMSVRNNQKYVAKKGNTYVALSFCKPEDRMKFLNRRGLAQ